jgi:hypothetical protein
MIEIRVNQESNKFIVCLYVRNQFIKKIAECDEEEYANLIAIKLQENL